VSFPLKAVIKGWGDALQLMAVGSKWELFVPPALGYGDRGARDKIGPNATLIFELELLAINGSSEDRNLTASPSTSKASVSKARAAIHRSLSDTRSR
jgi:hypothetical protein